MFSARSFSVSISGQLERHLRRMDALLRRCRRRRGASGRPSRVPSSQTGAPWAAGRTRPRAAVPAAGCTVRIELAAVALEVVAVARAEADRLHALDPAARAAASARRRPGPRSARCGGTGSGTMAASTPAFSRRTRSRFCSMRFAFSFGSCTQVEVQLVLLGAEAPDVLVRAGAHAVGHEAAVADLGDRRRLGRAARASTACSGRPGDHGRRRARAGRAPRRTVGRTSTVCTCCATRRPASLPARELHDERDADQLVEHAAAVQPLAVVLELLAVVGHEDDERAVVEPARLQLAHEAAELLVAVRDLAVVLRDQAVAVERLLVVVARVRPPGGPASGAARTCGRRARAARTGRAGPWCARRGRSGSRAARRASAAPRPPPAAASTTFEGRLPAPCRPAKKSKPCSKFVPAE